MNTLRTWRAGIAGYLPYLAMIFLNAFVDLGHKIVIQNTIFKLYDGPAQVVLTAIVNALILLPFILLFSPAGFIADRFPKHRVMRFSAGFALAITLLITVSYFAGWFWLAFGLTLVLAIQSAIYSPAKYGYIRELVGTELLAKANATVQALTIVAILLGTFVFSGLFELCLNRQEWTAAADILQLIAPVGFVLVALTLLELLLSLRLPARGQGSVANFSMADYGRGRYLRSNLQAVRSHPVIWLSIVGLALFWGVCQVVLAAFPAFAKETLHATNTLLIQGLLACSGVGIVLGSLLAGRISARHIDLGLIPLGALIMTGMLLWLPTLSTPLLMATAFIGIGLGGGLLLVPLNSLIQYHAGTDNSGVILAGNNWIQNIVMLGFLLLSVVFALTGLSSRGLLVLMALVCVGGSLWAIRRLPQSLVRIVAAFIFKRRYHINVIGFEHLPRSGPVLLLGNHISWIDWALVQIACPRPVRFVMLLSIYNQPLLKPIFKAFGVIPISAGNSKEALGEVNQALRAGEVVCLFPEGAISRNGQLGEFKRGYERALSLADDNGEGLDRGVILPFYLHGLWGSRFSRAGGGLRRNSAELKRDLFVAFGQPLPLNTTAPQLKQAVSQLSISAWSDYVERLPTVAEGFLRNACQHRSATACVDSANGQPLSYRRLLTMTLIFARALRQCSPTQGERIGILLPSSSAAIAANLAVMLRGQVAVNLNYTASPEACAQAISKANISTVLTADKFLHRLQAKGIDCQQWLGNAKLLRAEDIQASVSYGQMAASLCAASLMPARLLYLLFGQRRHIEDAAAVLFSSGSEGSPKGIELSHRNLMSNIKQISAMLDTRSDDVIMGGLPPFHSFGLAVTTLLPVVEGIPVVCHPDPTDTLNMAKAIARHQATILCATATFLRLYCKNRKVEPLMLESLRVVVAGAEKLQEEVRTAFERKFNKIIYEGYGATETTPVASVNIPDRLDLHSWKVQRGNQPGSVGLPVPGSCFRIVDPQTLATLPTGEDGLILIAGNQVMLGYLNDPAKTGEVIVELDGQRWYKTGDKGHLDENGFLTIVDRYSRFAKIGGEMVSLGAVEATALTLLKPLDDKLELMAIALPDDKKGEKVVMLVATSLEAESLQKTLIQGGMPPLLLPAQLYVVTALPVLGTGKKDVQGAKQLVASLAAGQ